MNPGRVRDRQARLRGRWEAAEERLRTALRDEGLVRARETAESRRLAKLRGDRDRAAHAFDQRDFHRAVELTQLDVTLDGVLHLASLAAMATAVGAIVALAVAWVLGQPGTVVAAIAAVSAIGPVASYACLAAYPEALARKLRTASLGCAPEAVNYMAMSMRVVPALDRAVEFAALHSEEPLASRLRALIWEVHLRDTPGIEAAFLRFAAQWGEGQDDLKRAFFAIGSAALERTEAGLDRVLEKARRIAFDGTKARVREYAAGLRGPTTALFALGVLLPLIVGSMLPLLIVGGIAPSLVPADRSVSGSSLVVPTVLAIDVLFPLGAFAYARRILGTRPGTATSPEDRAPTPGRLRWFGASLLAAAGLGFALARTPTTMYLPLWTLVAASLVFFLPGLRTAEARRRSTAAIEAEFPDALFMVGSRIAEGSPAERALVSTAKAIRGTHVASLFSRVVRHLQTSRAGLDAVLFGPNGALAEIPSRTVRAAFRMILEVSRKDPTTAGKTIVDTSAYLRDLQEVDREIRRDLSSTVDAMESTANLFAPLVLGVTCALYGLMARAFSHLVLLDISPALFVGIVGVYLLLEGAVTTYFRVGIVHGRDPTGVRTQLVRTWPVSMGVFTATFFVAQIALAG